MTEFAKLVLAVDSTQAKDAANNLDELSSSSKKAESESSILKSTTIALGYAMASAAAAGVAMVKSQIDAADAASDAAQAAGTSVEKYTQLAYAMKFGADGAASLDDTLKFLNKSVFDAATGNEKAQASFHALGVAYQNADGSMRDSTDVMLDVAEKFAAMEDGAQKSGIAMDLMGKSGAEMVPFLNQGRAGIEALTAEADKYGVTISGSVADAAGQFNDNIVRGQTFVQGFGNQIMKAMLPALNNLSNEFVATAGSTDSMESAASGVVAILKGVVTVGVTASATLHAIGNALGGVAAATAAALSGDFAAARDIMSTVFDDTVNIASNTMTRIDGIWNASAATVEQAEERKRTAIMATHQAVQNQPIGGAPATAAGTVAAPAQQLGPTDEEILSWLEREGAAHAQVESMREWYRQKDIEAETAASEARKQLAEQEAMARASAMDGMFNNLISLMSGRSKTMFNIGKAAAISQTVLSTYEGAQKAYASLAGIPIIGPALGIAAAGAAIAAGAARVSAIRSQSFGGSGSVSNVGGGGGGIATGGGFSGSTQGGGLIQQQPARQAAVDIRLTGIRPDDMISGSYLQKIIEGIGNTLADNGGRMGRVELVTA